MCTKPILILLLSLFLGQVTGGMVYAQEVLDLYPNAVDELALSEAGAKRFEKRMARAEAIWKSMGENKNKGYEDLSPEEKEIIDGLDETMEDYWDIVGVGCSWYCGGGPKTVSASSELASQGEIDYSATHAHDLNYKNAWAEGVSGNGIGEYLTYTFDDRAPRINTISVVNGYVKSQKSWEENGRVKTLRVSIKGEPFALLHLENSRSTQSFAVPLIGNDPTIDSKDTAQWTMKFEILEVYPGSTYEDVVISEIFFDGIDVHCFVAGTPITLGDGGQRPIEKIQKGDVVLSFNDSLGEPELDTVVETAAVHHKILAEIVFSNGDTLVCTPDHPIKSVTGAWLSCIPQKTELDYDLGPIEQLQEGCQINGSNGELTVVSIKPLREPQMTYTIESLKNNQTFQANGIWVGTEPLRIRHTCGYSSVIHFR